MKRIHLLCLLTLSLLHSELRAQDTSYQNTATLLIQQGGRLSIRGYAELTYNQPYTGRPLVNGKMDAKRLVTFMGYRFNARTSFISELEVEHGSEIYIEQAFLNHRINPYMNLRAGVLLIPMGIVNEYHEPTTFHGVERPSMDHYIYPTTWRELGAGLQGIVPSASIAYQAYIVNGFMGYQHGKGTISATGGFRSGRQKGIKSTFRHPNAVAKIDYFGLRNLKVGISGYVGKTESDLYNGLSGNTDSLLARADSSVIGLAMLGLDARYQYRNLQVRGQFNYSAISNTGQYNAFTGHQLGTGMRGYYLEVAYNVLPSSSTYRLFPFVRYEDFDTQSQRSESVPDASSQRKELTAGLSFFLHDGVVLKGDYQDQLGEENDRFNLGVGIWF